MRHSCLLLLLPTLFRALSNSPSFFVASLLCFNGLCLTTELQVSVAGSKAILAKIEVLPEYTSAVPPLPALPATAIFRFIGSDAEKSREIFTKALPKFPFPPDSPPLSGASLSASSPVKGPGSSATPKSGTPPPKGTSQPKLSSPSASKTPEPSTDKALEDSVLSSTSQTRQLRERRIALLRRDEKLRTAYHDLVIAPPNIFSDEEFWLNYAWESPSEADVVGPPEASESSGPISAATSASLASGAGSSSKETGGKTISLLDEEEAQKSIENEIADFSGFFDLLSRSLVDDRLKLSLTPALKKQIYEEFPMVRVAFDAKVPSTMSAAEFWNVFFKAQLAKLMRIREEKKTRTVRDTRKKAKKTTAKDKAPDPAAPPKKLSEEEKQLAFFEKLTDTTPVQLEKLVWQSRASDAISKDPSQNKMSQRGSLISVLAEDDAVSSGRNSENALSLARSLHTSHITPPSNSGFVTDNALEMANAEETEGTPARRAAPTNKSFQATVLAQQQDALKQRISLISRGVSSSATLNTKEGSDATSAVPSHPSAPASSLSATITAEEMLFSALQDQAATARTSRAKVSTGQQSVLDSWQATAASDGGIEVLDGIMVEQGELDDDSWTELKKEKDRRSRHLQLIRKFNRHGHIIVSSTSNDDEPSPQQSKPADTRAGETHQKYVFLSQKVDSGYHNQQFGEEVKMDVDDETHEGGAEIENFDDSAPSRRNISAPPTPHKPTRVTVKREDGSTGAVATTLTEVYALWPSLPRAAEPEPPKEPSLTAVSGVLQEMSEWTATLKRLKRPLVLPLDLASDAGNSMDYDLGGVYSMLEKVDQWQRHFWNLMERAGASKNRRGTLDFTGSEKLTPIVSQLSTLLESIDEMFNFLNSVQTDNQGRGAIKNLNISTAILRLQRQKMSVNRCLDLYDKLRTT